MAERRTILYLDDIPPSLNAGYGYPRAWRILEALASWGYEIVFLARFSTLVQTEATALDRRIRFTDDLNWISTLTFDFIVVSRIKNLLFFQVQLQHKFPTTPVIYDAECITAIRNEAAKNLFSSTAGAGQLMSIETELEHISKADAVLTTGPFEQRVLNSGGIKNAFVVPYFVETRGSKDFEERNGFAMLGRFFGLLGGAPLFAPPNEDLIDYMFGSILPEIADELDLRLTIGGMGSENIIVPQNLRYTVHLAGPIDDLDLFFRQFSVFAAPTRYSSGISLKVIEAMARGIPVVMTENLRVQMELDPECIVAADSPTMFARSLVALSRDRDKWNRFREDGLKIIRRRFSKSIFYNGLSDAIGACRDMLPNMPTFGSGARGGK